MKELVSKLDLTDFIDSFYAFLAREKPLYMEGDINLHYRFINEISKLSFSAPKSVKNLDTELMHLKKFGVLKIYEVYEFVKIINYFKYLKTLPFEGAVSEWLSKIVIPKEIDEICSYFTEKGELREDIDERFLSVSAALSNNKEKIRTTLNRLLATAKLSPYLVDRQIHYINGEEALLVRGGFNHILKATVVGRSSGGFFYVVPEKISSLKKEEADLLSKREEIVYEYEKNISSTFNKFLKFLRFINREFDRFDHYQARIAFAKSKDLEFILPNSKRKDIVLKNFIHPALHDPKPVNVEFNKKILMITGVNAGGKTMLLKSILSAVFLSKYLLPMKIDKHHSKIAHFKEIIAVVDDPQNVKNDISTFAGRMVEFSKLFTKDHFIAGIDEIELGTDSDEAASLFKVILEKLLKKDIKIVITTHHKRLASMMATNEEVELMAALYDEVNRRPTYEFLKGTIGKSYAFETALRYGIPANIVGEAKKVYGEDQEKLNELIQKNIELELSMRDKEKRLDRELERVQKQNRALLQRREDFEKEIKEVKQRYETLYNEAIEEAKRAAREKSAPEIHKALNEAYKKRKRIKEEVKEQKPIPLQKGDRVKYGKNRGVILSLKKNEAMIETDEGIKLRVPLSELKRSGNSPKSKPKVSSVYVQKPKKASVTLDLHGLRSDEAVEKLDKFISDALISGFDEILVYHGIGTGKLAYAVKEFLKTHPKVKSFKDAPLKMGGYGATLVEL